MTRLLVLAALVGAAVFAAPSATAKHSAPGAAKAPSFGGDIVLPGGQGAEPSMAIDTSPTASRGDIYVAAIGDPNGPLEWHSYDCGKTWSQPVPFDTGGQPRGGDQDIAVNTNGDLLAADLERRRGPPSRSRRTRARRSTPGRRPRRGRPSVAHRGGAERLCRLPRLRGGDADRVHVARRRQHVRDLHPDLRRRPVGGELRREHRPRAGARRSTRRTSHSTSSTRARPRRRTPSIRRSDRSTTTTSRSRPTAA